MKNIIELENKIKIEQLTLFIYERLNKQLDISDSNIYTSWYNKDFGYFLYIGKENNNFYFLNYSLTGLTFNKYNEIFCLKIDNYNKTEIYSRHACIVSKFNSIKPAAELNIIYFNNFNYIINTFAESLK